MDDFQIRRGFDKKHNYRTNEKCCFTCIFFDYELNYKSVEFVCAKMKLKNNYVELESICDLWEKK